MKVTHALVTQPPLIQYRKSHDGKLNPMEYLQVIYNTAPGVPYLTSTVTPIETLKQDQNYLHHSSPHSKTKLVTTGCMQHTLLIQSQPHEYSQHVSNSKITSSHTPQ
ncbi:hypothetical protein O181_084494 [Austropuccinia psidii MF-1]|uniref:Uncharacterized protein n=1 Tax=Austropuccinia psidii MF-1 TaxID=1389203 RepID=A0A9Q3IMM1_9BASI|nr:hypothetical protein [Austropuccinia psidii MF-1]